MTTTALLAAAGLLAPLLLDQEAAMAVPALIKGRTFSLIHPGGWELSVDAGWAVLRRASVATPHATATLSCAVVRDVLLPASSPTPLPLMPSSEASSLCLQP